MARVNSAQVQGLMFNQYKNNSSTLNTVTKIATFIVANSYDQESIHGENRDVLINMIAQALDHFKGNI